MGELSAALGTRHFWWLLFGFAAQTIFFTRFIVQWIASERRGRSLVPDAFWYLSLTGGLMLAIYALYRRDPVFLAGQSTGVFIYLRNIILIKGRGGKRLALAVALLMPCIAVLVVLSGAVGGPRPASVRLPDNPYWVVFGFLAQSFFFMRFLVQWIASERQKRSVIPRAFWYMSLAGSLALGAYALHRRDPVFVLGQTVGVLIYTRNIVLLHRGRRKSEANGS